MADAGAPTIVGMATVGVAEAISEASVGKAKSKSVEKDEVAIADDDK